MCEGFVYFGVVFYGVRVQWIEFFVDVVVFGVEVYEVVHDLVFGELW